MIYFFLSSILANVLLGDIWCSEEYGCENEELSSDEVSCMGYYSCSESTIESNTTFCSGDYACSDSTIQTQELYCTGNNGCNSASSTVEGCDSFVMCNGFFSCEESEITAPDSTAFFAAPSSGYEAMVDSNNLYSISALGFINGEASIGTNLYCDGIYSCAYGEFTFNSDSEDLVVVQVMGAYGLYGATVNSGENNQINWYFYGLWSISSATINCEEGSTCDFYCIGGGCMNYDTASYTCNGECTVYCIYTFDDACPTGDDETISVQIVQGDEASEKLKLIKESSILASTLVSEHSNTELKEVMDKKRMKHDIKRKRKLHNQMFFANIMPSFRVNYPQVWFLIIVGVLLVGSILNIKLCSGWLKKKKESHFQVEYQSI